MINITHESIYYQCVCWYMFVNICIQFHIIWSYIIHFSNIQDSTARHPWISYHSWYKPCLLLDLVLYVVRSLGPCNMIRGPSFFHKQLIYFTTVDHSKWYLIAMSTWMGEESDFLWRMPEQHIYRPAIWNSINHYKFLFEWYIIDSFVIKVFKTFSTSSSWVSSHLKGWKYIDNKHEIQGRNLQKFTEELELENHVTVLTMRLTGLNWQIAVKTTAPSW